MNQEVNKIVQELYSCLPNDRKKFNSIMDNLKVKFLSSSNPSKKNYDLKILNTNHSSQLMSENVNTTNNILPIKNNNNNNINYLNNSLENNSPANPLKVMSNFEPINLPTFNVQNNQYDEINNDDLGDYINLNTNGYQSGAFNENYYENKKQNDMHANCKYYYPEEYNSQFSDNKIQNSDWNNKVNSNNLMYGSKNNFYKMNNE